MTPDEEAAAMRLLDAIEGAAPPLDEDPIAMMLGIVKPYCNLGNGSPLVKGYTAKVGLRKALRLRKIDWLNQAIRETSDLVMRSVWSNELYLLTGPYWHRGGFKGVAYDNGGWLGSATQTFNAYAAEPVLRHCGSRTLTGDHHAVCDCPPSANLADNRGSDNGTGLRTVIAHIEGMPPDDVDLLDVLEEANDEDGDW